MSRLQLATRSASTLVRILQLMIAILVLGAFSYFLAFLHTHHMFIPRWQKAVEGMAGAAVIYTAFAVILTFFLGGITVFALIAVILDICFCGCFIAIAILTKAGAKSCGKLNDSPIGLGQHTSCQLQRAVFAVAIVAAFLFLISATLQILLSRTHKKEKRYGPSPSNNYTSGSGKRAFWARKNRKNRDAELATVGTTPTTTTTTAGGLVAAEQERKHHYGGGGGGMHDPAMTGNGYTADGYGGPDNKYATREPTVPVTTNGYAPQQTSGVMGGGAGTSVPEMPANTHLEGGPHVGGGRLGRGDLP